MATSQATVTVRMYYVGFGDAFVVTVRDGHQQWRMLIDCGVHAQGTARPIHDSVKAIIADLTAESGGRPPHLDVVAATHHHADHITGFACDDWEQVSVGDVWVPFVEDPNDPDARMLRNKQTATANALSALLDNRVGKLDAGSSPVLAQARWFAANSSGNETATDRLLSRNGKSFANTPPARFLPFTDPTKNVIDIGVANAVVHVLGPSRDPHQLKRMDPPSKAAWLALDPDSDPLRLDRASMPALFNSRRFVMPESQLELAQYMHLLRGHQALRGLDHLDDDALLAAASMLEGCVNNTSLFLVLDVAGTHLVFPGDTQEGGWDHVLDDNAARALVADAVFYKVAHHGSGNATPKRYLEEILHDGADTMLPWGLVKRWQATIPAKNLMAALAAHQHTVIRADAPQAIPGKVTVDQDGWWSEVTIRCSPGLGMP